MTRPDTLYLVKPIGIIRNKRLTSVEADYLCLIAQLHNSSGCIASNQYFADYFGVARTTAVEIISSLRRKKIISTTEKKSGGKTILRTIVIIDADSRKNLLSDSRESRPIKQPGIVGSSDRDSREHRPSNSRKSPNHTIEYTIEHTIETLFDTFWKAYPKKISKPAALKAFRKANPDEALLSVMLAAIAAQKASEQWQRDDGRFIPYPATWLNGERWNDKNEVAAGGYIPNDPTESEADELLQKAGIL